MAALVADIGGVGWRRPPSKEQADTELEGSGLGKSPKHFLNCSDFQAASSA